MSTNNHNSSNDNVDERVVSMRFDNAEFERRTKTTMNTLDKLKAKLNFKGATDSLQKFSRESSKFNLDGVSGAVQACQNKISAWEIAGITAIANITNSAVNAGKKITKALTIEPVFTGFSEYETKINSIQTIMSNTASKGTTMEEVVRVIDELNTYADLTIYNFSEMTRNIGTFTAAGIGLQDAADSIQGIANLAAASGSNSQQASTAMYQLSQALAAGTVKLQDWNSVVNAGMGGELFQNALKQTAREMGIAVDEIIESQGSFRESLSQGWMTADVLSTTLRKFTKKGAKEYSDAMMASGQYTQEMADSLAAEAQNMEDAATKVKTFTQLWDTLKETAQSGWGKTWELIIGNFDEAKELFTNLNNRFSPILDKMSDARNAVIEGAMGSPSKWEEMIKLVNKAGVSTEDFKNALGKSIGADGAYVDSLVEKYGSLEAIFSKGIINRNAVRVAISSVVDEQKSFGKTTMNAAQKLEYFQKLVDEVWAGDWDNNPERMRRMTEANINYEAVQELVNKTVDGHRLILEDLTSTQMKAIGFTEEEIAQFDLLKKASKDTNSELYAFIETLNKKTGRELLVQSIYNILDAIGNVLSSIGKAFRDVFSPVQSDDLYSIIEAFEKFTRGLIINEDQMDKLRRTFKGLFSIIDAVKMVLSSGLRLAFKVVGALLGNINIDFLSLTATIGDALGVLAKWIKEHDLVSKVMEKIGPILEKAGAKLGEWISAIKSSKNITKDIGDALSKGFGYAINVVKDTFKKLLNTFGNGVDDFVSEVATKPKTVGDKLVAMYETIKQSIFKSVEKGSTKKIAGNYVKNVTHNLSDAITKALPIIADKLKTAFIAAKTWFEKNVDPAAVIGTVLIFNLYRTVSKMMDVVEKFAKPAEQLGDMFENIGDTFKATTKVIASKSRGFRNVSIGILMLALSITALAASVYMLTKTDSESLARATGVVASLMVLMTIMAILVSTKMANLNSGISNINITVILSFCLGLLVICYAIKKLTEIETDKLDTGVTYMSVILIELLAVMAVLFTITRNSKTIDMAAIGIIALGLGRAMVKMAKAVKIAGSMHRGILKQGLAFVMTCSAMFALLVAAVHTNGRSILAAGLMLSAASFAMSSLVGTVLIAGKIDSDVLKQALKVMGGITVIMAGLLLISNIGGRLGAGFSIMGMAIAMALMVHVIKYIGNVDMGDIDYANTILVAIGMIFAKFMAVSLFAGKNAIKAGTMLMQAAIAIGILTGIMWLITKLKTSDKEMGAAMVVVGMMSRFMTWMIKASRGATDARKNIIASAIAVALLVGAVYALYFISKNYKRLAIAIAAFGAIVYGLTAVINSTRRLTKSKIGALSVLMAGMLVLTGAISALVIVMGVVSKFTGADYEKLILSMAAIFAAMSTMVFAIGKTASGFHRLKWGDIGKVAATLGILIIVMGAVGALITVLSLPIFTKQASWEQLAKIAAVMTYLVAVSLAIANFGKNTPSWGDLAKIGTTIVALGVSMLLISFMLTLISKETIDVDWNVLAQLMAVTSVLVGLSLLITNFGKSSASNITGSLAVLGGLIVVAYAMTGVLAILGLIENADGMITKVTAMSLLLLALSAATVIIVNFAKTADIASMSVAALGVLELAVVCFVIGAVIRSIEDVNAEGAIQKAVAIGILVNLLSIAAAFCAGAGAVADKAILGALAVGVLGAIIVGIIKLFEVAMSASLPTFGENIGKFGVGISPFIVTMRMIDNKATEGAGNLVKMMLGLGEFFIMDSFLEFFGGTGWTKAIGDKLLAFGQAAVDFSNILSEGNFNSELVNSAVNIGNMLVALEKGMHVNPEWINAIFGSNDMGAFGKRLSEFATGIKEFDEKLNELGTFDEKKTNNFCNAVKPILKMAKQIPNSGGVLEDLVGGNDIDTWGAKLPKFAMYMALFNDAIMLRKWNILKFSNFANCVRPLLELSQDIPNSGGVLGDLVGNNDIDDFGSRLPEFGKGVAGFVDAIKGHSFVKDQFEKVRDCLDVIIEIAGKIPSDQDGWLYKLMGVGKQDLGTFGTNLTSLGLGLADYGSAIEGVDSLSSGEAITITENISKLVDVLPDKSAVEKISKKIQNMVDNNMSLRLYDLGSMLTSWSNSTSTLNSTNLNGATTSLDLLVSALNNSSKLNFDSIDQFGESLKLLGADTVGGFVNAFEGSYSKINETLYTFINNIDNIFKINEYLWRINGQHVPDKFKTGIENHQDEAFTKITELIRDCAAKADKYTSAFESVGKNYTMGMISGLYSVKDKLIEAATELGDIASDSTKKALDEHSPSKVMEHIGEFAGLGFINGIKQLFGLANTTSENLGEGVSTSLTEMLQDTLEIFNSSDFRPTITPVLDLSLVRSGISDISSILNGNMPTIGYYGGSYTATNDDVISAINELNETLNNLEINNYTVGNVTYDEGSAVGNAVKQLVSAANIRRRV